MSRLAHASRRLNLEPLEDRTLMSTCHVTRLTDQGVGKVCSLKGARPGEIYFGIIHTVVPK